MRLMCVHRLLNTLPLVKLLSEELRLHLNECCMALMSYIEIHRTRSECRLVESIRHCLSKSNNLFRVTDKSGIFQVGHVTDYEQKAEVYCRRTQACIESESNLLWSVFAKVVQLLNEFRTKRHILASQYEQMMSNKEKVELAPISISFRRCTTKERQ
jgi:hypothetical protein